MHGRPFDIVENIEAIGQDLLQQIQNIALSVRTSRQWMEGGTGRMKGRHIAPMLRHSLVFDQDQPVLPNYFFASLQNDMG